MPLESRAPKKRVHNPVAFTVVALALILPLLLGGGLLVRNLVATSFHTGERIRAAQSLAEDALRHQLDEQTSIRAYLLTRDPEFLEPYHMGVASFSATVSELRNDLNGLGLEQTLLSLDDAARTNNRWLQSVATPILTSRVKPERVERREKDLVDRFRSDIASVQGALGERESITSARANDAVDRIGLFLAAVLMMMIALAIAFVAQQTRLFDRLDEDRRASEAESRRLEALQAAYLTEKRISETLQDAFTQHTLPTLPALRFSATYTPATEETKIGGDWYDALELPGNRVLFAVGDVAGHGIEAAVTMSRTRQLLIASSMLDTDPASLLHRVNASLNREASRLVTAVTGFADARTYEFVYASAGHPPPVLLEPGRAPRLLAFGGPPLGSVDWAQYQTHRIQTVPGAMLVLYTDGAIEHSRDVLEGEAILLEATSRAAESSDDPASFIHDAIFNGRTVGDDVAILTIGFTTDRRPGFKLSADDSQAGFSGRFSRRRDDTQADPIDARSAGTQRGFWESSRAS
ncbi:MAG: SpoIIE family protein phosphatase [Candidatus Eremiobacteraeota bacterium]|nr:SpoIIE family protein phosphatase [Candidatus Eremiobacteraeota bacterium]